MVWRANFRGLFHCAKMIYEAKRTPISSHRGLMRQPTKELFHCAKMIYGTQKNTDILAQGTHEAAHEGTVPLCKDDIWNPKEHPESPHSGLMRQPAREGPV